MQKKFIITVVATLIVGAGIGYLIGSSKDHQSQPMAGSESSGTMGAAHGASPDAMLKELEENTGSARDSVFLESMIVHHQSAIDMSKIVLESTKRPELEKLAQEIISAQTKEIEMMKGWQSAWYGR